MKTVHRTLQPMLFIACINASFLSFGNNIRIDNVSLTGQNTVEDYTMVRFDISWDNSWRTSTLENNWDAAWIFVKYRKKADTDWSHAYMNDAGHTTPTGGTITPGLVTPGSPFNATTNPAVGAFLYRNSDGIGNVNFSGAELRWNYGVNGLADYDSVEVCVFALEMVYIPQGAFYLGDNIVPGSSSSGHFVAGTTTDPFQLTSEAELTIGNTATSQVWGTSESGNNTIGSAGTLPSEFPKGYGGFYIMKYELSQYMYKEFLNKLTRTQQAARVSATTVGRYMSNNNSSSVPQVRNGIRVMSDPGGVLPRVYGNDLNNNDVEGEAEDGQHIACNWLSFGDLIAFADWCGLRPFTELEYEKTCRGILNSVANEYAWGNTNATNATSITNSGQTNEVAGNSGANLVSNNAANVQGPMRNGNFAGSGTNREQSGAAYYGVMELSGNLWEYTISVGRADNRTFNGRNNGNGILTSAGASDVGTWPATSGLRGGQWASTGAALQVSDRSAASTSTSYAATRSNWGGIRLARTEP